MCQAKDRIVKVKEEEKQQLQEEFAKKLEEMGVKFTVNHT